MSTDAATRQLARDLLVELGIDRATLSSSTPAPTIAEFMPTVRAAASPGTTRTYDSYWQRAVDTFGTYTLTDLRPSDVLAMQRQTTSRARQRTNSRNGRYAGEHAIRAMRYVYRLAVADGLLTRENNPAAAVATPRRLPSTRRPLSTAELADVQSTVQTGGRDIALDSLLIRLHVETACRRGGALALRLQDLDTDYCRVMLREKFGTQRWQPISPTLATALATHAHDRGARCWGDSLLRNRDHGPMSRSRYDLLWNRVHDALPWAAQLGVTAHWLRYTTLCWVERHFSYAVARAYAGHTDAKGGSTLTYVMGLPGEVATALQALTREPHPLALLPYQDAWI